MQLYTRDITLRIENLETTNLKGELSDSVPDDTLRELCVANRKAVLLLSLARSVCSNCATSALLLPLRLGMGI